MSPTLCATLAVTALVLAALPALLTIANLREWRASAASHTEAYEAHGVPRAEAVRAALDEVVREVLVPGFAHAGLDVRGLERWARAGLGAQSE